MNSKRMFRTLIHRSSSPLTAALAVFLTLASVVSAQPRSGIPGPKGSIRTAIPAVVTDTLANGLRYYFTRVNNLPVIDFNVVVDAGMSAEAGDEAGLAFVTVHQLLSGSEKRSRQMIEDFLHEQASIVVPYAHYDYAQLYVRTLARNFSASMDVVADAITTAKFPDQQLEAFKVQASSRFPDQKMSAAERASQEVIAMLCGEGHILSKKLQPDAKDLATISTAQLREFHARYYSPERTTVIITGDIDPAFVKTVLTEQFGSWKRSRRPAVPAQVAAASQYKHLIINDSTTANNLAYYRIGLPALPQNDARFPSLVVLNSILSYGAHSRLRSALWGRHMISPSVTSSIGFSKDCAYLLISGSTSPDVADSVLLLINAELDALASNGITQNELDEIKAELLRDNSLMFSSNRNVQSLLKEVAVYGGTPAWVFAFSDRLSTLKAADVNALAADLFKHGNERVVVCGSAAKLEKPLSSVLGKVPVVQIDN